jgi:hypothetical protein
MRIQDKLITVVCQIILLGLLIIRLRLIQEIMVFLIRQVVPREIVEVEVEVVMVAAVAVAVAAV